MEKYLVADSYAKCEQVGEPFLKSGRQYIRIKGVCKRCGGSGHYGPASVNEGRCFRCGGSGTEYGEVRVYTEKEYAAMQRQKERAQARKEEERKRAYEEGVKYRHEAIVKFGFGEDEKIYVVYGGDTFAIKDQLKEMGAHFKTLFKWYFSEPVELPEGYFLLPVSFDEVCEYLPASKFIEVNPKTESIIKEKIAVAREETQPSDYYPVEEKERIRDIEVTFTEYHSFDGNYGTTFVYMFTLDTYTFVWMTSKLLSDIERGQKVLLTGTVKKFDMYDGIKTTYLTRCIVKEII